MTSCFVPTQKENVTPINLIVMDELSNWVKTQDTNVDKWLKATNFSAKPGTICYIGNQKGSIERVLFGISAVDDVWSIGLLPSLLQEGVYQLDKTFKDDTLYLALVAWGLGCYQFTRYRSAVMTTNAKLVVPEACDLNLIENTLQATSLVRDLINTPTEDMGPAELAEAAVLLAEEFDAKVNLIIGDDLLKKNYPAVHAVGRASIHAPRLIEMQWGNTANPHVTLVGKGVCFDTGGLDIKPANNMRFMKKDMAGAAHVLGLARMIMAANLPIRLRVLIPAVENAISGHAIRPGDIIRTRQGLTVEVNNTDAEGRLILADALAEAAREEPDLIIDFATLTGAARVALGPEPGAFFTEDEELAQALYHASTVEQDPLWRMPLYKPYRLLLESTVADLSNIDVEGVGGGAIVAALFLREFVPTKIPWVHLDIMAWNLRQKPSKPIGGEANGLRAVFRFLTEKFT